MGDSPCGASVGTAALSSALSMYVVHWTRHSNMDRIMRIGLSPQRRVLDDGKRIRGIWVYPYGANQTVNSNWRKILKERRTGNFNGIVFRLIPEDFPAWAGDFIDETHPMAPSANCPTLDHLKARVRALTDSYQPWAFEIILPRRVAARRFEHILKDRPGRRAFDTGPRQDED